MENDKIVFNKSESRSILGTSVEMKCGNSEDEGIFVKQIGDFSVKNDEEFQEIFSTVLKNTSGKEKGPLIVLVCNTHH